MLLFIMTYYEIMFEQDLEDMGFNVINVDVANGKSNKS